MYADDTTLSCCVDTIQSNDKDRVINTELSKVNNWLISNKLSLNINKRKYMLFHKAPNMFYIYICILIIMKSHIYKHLISWVYK